MTLQYFWEKMENQLEKPLTIQNYFFLSHIRPLKIPIRGPKLPDLQSGTSSRLNLSLFKF